jgi:hypothetical protein
VGELQYLTTPAYIKQELEKELQTLHAQISSTSQSLYDVNYQKQRIQEALEFQEQQNAKYRMQLLHLEELKVRYAEQQKVCMKNDATLKQAVAEVQSLAEAHVHSQAIEVQELERREKSRISMPQPFPQPSPPQPSQPLLPRPKVPECLVKHSTHPLARALAPELSPAQKIVKDILIAESRRLRAEGKNPADHGMNLPAIKALTAHAKDIFPPTKSRRGLFKTLVHQIPGVLCKGKDHNFVYYVL